MLVLAGFLAGQGVCGQSAAGPGAPAGTATPSARIWPGDVIRWGSHVEPELLLPLTADHGARPGFGFRLGFGLGESVSRSGVWGFDLGLASQPHSNVLALPRIWAGLSWGYPFSLGGAFRITPGIGLGIDRVLLSSAQPVGVRLETAIPLELHLRPYLFSPDGDGFDDTLELVTESGTARFYRDWRVEISDPTGRPFRSFGGAGAPPARLVWDGKSDGGELVEAATDYPLRLTVHDRFGVAKTYDRVARVDVLVVRDGDRWRLKVPDIAFGANSASLVKLVEGSFLEQNKVVLERLFTIFTRFPEYQIIFRGHANMLNWRAPLLAAREQDTELVPLSRQRAQAVKNALVSLGIGKERIAVEGVGGAEPIVPFSDSANSGKNRRVEIYLRKP